MMKVQTPASRRTDPNSSHMAEREINATGKRSRQQQQALDLVNRYPNHTSDELAHYGVLDRYQLARRLPELVTAGLVEQGTERRSLVSGRPGVTWHPKTTQQKFPLTK